MWRPILYPRIYSNFWPMPLFLGSLRIPESGSPLTKFQLNLNWLTKTFQIGKVFYSLINCGALAYWLQVTSISFSLNAVRFMEQTRSKWRLASIPLALLFTRKNMGSLSFANRLPHATGKHLFTVLECHPLKARGYRLMTLDPWPALNKTNSVNTPSGNGSALLVACGYVRH